MARTRAFRVLSWLSRPHGVLIRGFGAGVGGLAVYLLTGRVVLARETASLFWHDRIKLGAHRLHWYVTHSWAARFVPRIPLFDPTTQMPDTAVAALDAWLGDSQTHRLARLYVLARQIATAPDQAPLLDAYTRVATGLLPALPAPDPAARNAPSADFSLTDAKDALAALDVLPHDWYIISGTFLGAVREGTFLSHDYDVDIGIHAEDFDETAFLETISACPVLTLVNTSPHVNLTLQAGRWQGIAQPALYRIMHQSGIGIDVFIHHLDGDVRWHGSAAHRWDNSDFALADYTIAGLPVRGPADADRYLTENYGDWRTPVTSFDCATGTPNVSFPRNLAALAAHLRIAILEAGTADAEVARLVLEHECYLRGTDFALPWRHIP